MPKILDYFTDRKQKGSQPKHARISFETVGSTKRFFIFHLLKLTIEPLESRVDGEFLHPPQIKIGIPETTVHGSGHIASPSVEFT
jgi:hypothetical protein